MVADKLVAEAREWLAQPSEVHDLVARLAAALEAARTETLRMVMDEIRKTEEIDARHGFRLPGDSALYITFWGWESLLGELDREPKETET